MCQKAALSVLAGFTPALEKNGAFPEFRKGLGIWGKNQALEFGRMSLENLGPAQSF